MKVSNTYPSFKSLWENLPEKAKNIKNATYNPCGDIYQPKPDITNEFDPEQYYPPLVGHVHRENKNDEEWRNDINYSANNKRPALLVGDPDLSFLWFRPIIFYKNFPHPRTRKFTDIKVNCPPIFNHILTSFCEINNLFPIVHLIRGSVS